MVAATSTTNTDPNGYHEMLINRKDLMCTTKVVEVDIQRIPNLNNVLSVYSDQDGKSFVALQVPFVCRFHFVYSLC